MKRVALDASALIAAIYEEPGADIVERHLPQAIISTVNLTEVASYMVREGTSIGQAKALLEDLALRVVVYNAKQAFLAAAMLPKTKAKGLSLGDRACLALAMTEDVPVLTADKAWKALDVGVKITLIR